MLHIITPLYRFENLERLYESIPKYDDIYWHISISKKRGFPENDFIENDKRVKIYNLDCEDHDLVTKRNSVFEQIHDGYFYLLDDDTVFMEAAYEEYRKYQNLNFIGMIIGRQYRKLFNGIAQRPYDNPKFNNIDTGMAICHFSVLRSVKWEWCDPKYFRDCFFWSKCATYYGPGSIKSIKRYISIYNALNTYGIYRTLERKIFNKKIKYDIKNIHIARLIYILSYLKYIPKRISNMR